MNALQLLCYNKRVGEHMGLQTKDVPPHAFACPVSFRVLVIRVILYKLVVQMEVTLWGNIQTNNQLSTLIGSFD